MPESDLELACTFKVTEKDLLRATWLLLWRHKLLMGCVILLGVCGTLLGVWLLLVACLALGGLHQADPMEAVILAALILFLPFAVFGLFPLLVRWQALRAYRTNPMMNRATTYRFTAQGLSSVNPIARMELTWDAIFEIIETKKDFLFFVSKQSCFLVPKTVVPSPDEQQRLRRIVRAGAGDRAKLQYETS